MRGVQSPEGSETDREVGFTEADTQAIQGKDGFLDPRKGKMEGPKGPRQ